MKSKNCAVMVVLVMLFLLRIPFSFSQIQKTNESDVRNVLEALIDVAGVSFHEENVLKKIQELLPKTVASTVDDNMNLLVKIGSGKPEIIFVAHMDEIGLEVASINDDGTLTTRIRGGSFTTIWESKVVKIYTKRGIIDGIVQPRKTYREQSPAPHSRNDIIIYVGTDSKAETEKLGIQVNDYIVQPKRLLSFGKNRVCGGSIDDRGGCTAQILAVRQLAEKKLNKTVIFAWVVQEETGLTGSRLLSNTYSPDYVFAVDTFVSSDAPRDVKYIGYTPLGKGAVLRAYDSSNITPLDSFNKVRRIAESRSIPLQWGITSGGNDGSVFLSVGSIDIPLSWPGIYSHSYASIADIRDIMALTDLIVALAEQF